MAKLILELLTPRAPLSITHDLNAVDLSLLDDSALAERGISRSDVIDVVRRTMI